VLTAVELNSKKTANALLKNSVFSAKKSKLLKLPKMNKNALLGNSKKKLILLLNNLTLNTKPALITTKSPNNSVFNSKTSKKPQKMLPAVNPAQINSSQTYTLKSKTTKTNSMKKSNATANSKTSV
jgi:hypothetical protein